MNLTQQVGAAWQPAPTAMSWAKLNAPGGTVHLLIIECPVGRLAFAFAENELAEFIRGAQTQLTGLTLPVVDGLITP